MLTTLNNSWVVLGNQVVRSVDILQMTYSGDTVNVLLAGEEYPIPLHSSQVKICGQDLAIATQFAHENSIFPKVEDTRTKDELLMEYVNHPNVRDAITNAVKAVIMTAEINSPEMEEEMVNHVMGILSPEKIYDLYLQHFGDLFTKSIVSKMLEYINNPEITDLTKKMQDRYPAFFKSMIDFADEQNSLQNLF